MNLYYRCYQFKFSTVGTACAPLDTGDGTTCQQCYSRGYQVVLCIPQGVAAVPTFKVLGLAIWAQNPTKSQNKCYEMKDKGLSCYLKLMRLKMDGGNSQYQLWNIWLENAPSALC